MTRVTNTAQVLALLQAQLERLRRLRKQDPPGASAISDKRGALERMRDIAAADGISDSDASRALIGALLMDEFGDETANDAQFQHLVGEVLAAIERDPEAQALLKRAYQQLTRPTS